MNDDGYEQMVELWTFCLITGVDYRLAQTLTDTEIEAATEAWNAINKER